MKTQLVKKIKVISWIIGFIIFVSNFKMVVAGDHYNEDSIWVELFRFIHEIFIGFCLKNCYQNPSCNYFLTCFVCLFIFITILSMVFCGFRPSVKGRDLQSGINMYVGMILARK